MNKRSGQAGPPPASVPSLNIYYARNIGEMLNFTLPPARCIVHSSVSSNFFNAEKHIQAQVLFGPSPLGIQDMKSLKGLTALPC